MIGRQIGLEGESIREASRVSRREGVDVELKRETEVAVIERSEAVFATREKCDWTDFAAYRGQ